MKKLFAFILVAVMTFSMVACGGETNEGGEISGEDVAGNQSVGKVEQVFDFKALGSYGLPEPSFSYSYKYYEETMQGMRADGEPNLLPKFTFEINTDRTSAHEYMGEVKAAGWAGDLPALTENAGGAFWYVSENENYKINITWEDTTDIGEITVIDKTKSCVWDDKQSIYVIDGVENFDEYAPYKHA
ncbi:MAG: hypothetical protein IKK99_05360 [Oscillospiraceae bacterium]|nr:hypothetical protein [Oscillospiraceae bacterium]